MSEGTATAGSPAHHVSSPISVAWVIAAALISGAGLVVIWMWLETFSWTVSWGPFLVLVGMLMFLSDRAGLDHA